MASSWQATLRKRLQTVVKDLRKLLHFSEVTGAELILARDAAHQLQDKLNELKATNKLLNTVGPRRPVPKVRNELLATKTALEDDIKNLKSRLEMTIEAILGRFNEVKAKLVLVSATLLRLASEGCTIPGLDDLMEHMHKWIDGSIDNLTLLELYVNEDKEVEAKNVVKEQQLWEEELSVDQKLIDEIKKIISATRGIVIERGSIFHGFVIRASEDATLALQENAMLNLFRSSFDKIIGYGGIIGPHKSTEEWKWMPVVRCIRGEMTDGRRLFYILNGNVLDIFEFFSTHGLYDAATDKIKAGTYVRPSTSPLNLFTLDEAAA
tara:strand:- start:1790 stop:2758 length:969 start_codon:yes stop_codon:yes gene_type:complete